ncbi:MAG TPA: glucan biosynthesis protein [Sphingomonas sp.]|nr:glucan biosynthesis protein [Sphingomonas sp.]
MNSRTFTRREAATAAMAAALAALPAYGASASTPFTWDWLKARARDLAARPHVAPPPPPRGATSVTYDVLNHVSYRPDATIWPDSVGGVRLFPLSISAPTPVSVTLVEGGRARPFDFRRDLFTGAEKLSPDIAGFAGLRLMNRGGSSDWLAFQGASYFRAAGALDQYGLSARALAIDTGLGKPEEFPRFTHFWLEQGPGDAITIYALLDSPSAAGAWRFVNRRTSAGVIQDVSMSLYLRADVERLGLAPLTSMFWYGEAARDRAVDWRPEIHDSDGLAMLNGSGERIWRPLDNPPRAILNSFADRDPRGFGLLQRDRNFDHYQDDGVFYEKRPSLWVEPIGKWGAGSVTLFELPTGRETADNIVAFWTPATAARRGARYELEYRLSWIADEPQPSTAARTADCWRGVAGRPGGDPIPDAARLVADFVGPPLHGLGRSSGVEAVVELSSGKPISVTTYPVVGAQDRWRMIVDIPHKSGETNDLRAYLRRGDAALSETLLYQFL